MARSFNGAFSGLIIALSLFDARVPRAAEAPTIAGDYLCKAFCRLSDAPPSIEIDGTTAKCMSELGGIYKGKVLRQNSVYCFNKVGTLSDDGKTLLWSDGAVWERR